MPVRNADRRQEARRVRRDLPIPYWAQLVEILQQEIASGVWGPGDTLPSEADLCATHGVSRTAVRQALGDLAARGIVHKQRGRRTAVAGMTSLIVQEMRGFSDEMLEQGKQVRTEVLKLETAAASGRVARDLNIPNGAHVVLLCRCRDVGDETFVYTETHLPLPRFAALLDEDLTQVSLYAVLGERFGVRPSLGRRSIEAVAADGKLPTLLRTRRGAPTLKLTAVNYDQDGAPFEVFEAWYRGDATRFELVIGT